MAKTVATGPVAGSKKHAYAKRLTQRHDRLYGKQHGSRGLECEVPYKEGRPLEPGDSPLGSVRLDTLDEATMRVYPQRRKTPSLRAEI